MKDTILFIHGMFQNDKSWQHWINYFEQRGYSCEAIAWPFHEGEPGALRNNMPEGLGTLHLETVIDKFAAHIGAMATQPILVGHSVGGLIVQVLASRGLAKAGVCICSVAPNRMLALDWGLFRNAASITNPFKGDEPFIMTPAGFHQNFCNTMTEEESNQAYEKSATHDSRNMLRDCLLGPGDVDLSLPHVPLLFLSAEQDEIIPADLCEKNSKAYEDETSIVDYRDFPGRGHYICGQPGWEEVANYTQDWLKSRVPMQQAAAAGV